MPKKVSKESLLETDVSFGGINLTQKAIFTRHLAVMLQAGLTISEAVEIARDQGSGKFKKILTKILLSLNSGQSFSVSLGRYPKIFPGSFTSVIEAGEKSGNLEENLANIADNLEKERQLLAKIKGAMLYPAVVLIAAFGLGIALSFFVLPKITPLFEGLKIDLPFTTRALIWFSSLIRDHGALIFFLLAFFIVFLIWLVRRKFSKPLTHFVLLRIPIIGKLFRYTNLARFTRSLGTLLKSGLNIDEALEITRSTLRNYYYAKSLEEVSRTVSKGTKLSAQLAKREEYYPKLVTRMIKVGEETGKLDESLLFLADFYEGEVDNQTKSLSTAIEPILLIVIGCVVAFLALSIITPIYQITGNVRR